MENGRGSSQITRFGTEGIKPTGKMTCFEGYSKKMGITVPLTLWMLHSKFNQSPFSGSGIVPYIVRSVKSILHEGADVHLPTSAFLSLRACHSSEHSNTLHLDGPLNFMYAKQEWLRSNESNGHST